MMTNRTAGPLLLLAAALAACGGDPAPRVQVERDTVGDTLVVRTLAGSEWGSGLELEPEVSHNVNLGLTTDFGTPAGWWQAEVNGFLREASNLILELPAYGQRFRNENVFAARSVGVEASARWTSPDDAASLAGTATYLDFRNRTDTGPFAPFDGDRIPNRPYVLVSGSARLQIDDPFPVNTRVSLSWDSRFVDDFFEFWESAGTRGSKRVIPDQLLHALAVTYLIDSGETSLSFAAEVANLTDAQAYDFFGAQRPGRAVYFKTTVSF